MFIRKGDVIHTRVKVKLTVQVGKGGMLKAGGTAGRLNPKVFLVLLLVISDKGSA